MSKRLQTTEEWSDDDIEGIWLSGSPKRVKSSSESKVLDQSSIQNKDTLFKKAINRLTDSVNKVWKAFKSPERRDMNSSMANESSVTPRRGITPTNDSNHRLITNCHSFGTQNTPNLQQNIIQLIPINTINTINTIMIKPSGAIISQSPQMVILAQNQVYSTNISTTPIASLQPNNMQNKCINCGQISASPINGRNCGHCSGRSSFRSSSHFQSSISTNQFYGTSNQSRSSTTNPNLNLNSLSETPKRSLQPNQRIRHLSGTTSPLTSTECIDLEESIIDVPDVQKSANNCLETHNYSKSPSSRSSLLSNKLFKCQHCDQVSDSSLEGRQCPHCLKPISTSLSLQRRSLFSNDWKDCDIDDNVGLQVIGDNKQNDLLVHPKHENESIFGTSTLPQYVLFGTYKAEVKTVEFTDDGIKFTNVSPNCSASKFKYHIMIPYNEIVSLKCCTDPIQPTLLVEPNNESNNKIQESLNLGKSSKNGLRFNTTSEDKREKFIIIVLKECISDTFYNRLRDQIKCENQEIKIETLNLKAVKAFINETLKRFNDSQISGQQFDRLIQMQNTSQSLLTPNPYSLKHSSHSSPVTRNTRSRYQPIPQPMTIQIDDDEDEEEIIESKNLLDSQFDKVIFTYPEDEPNGIQVIGNDVLCLNREEFLNDNVVNFYLRYYYKELLEKNMCERVHIFDTLFFIQLTEKRPTKRKNIFTNEEPPYTFEQRYEKKLKKWTKNIDLFTKDFLVFPIIKESHWFLAIVCYHNLVQEITQKVVKKDSPNSKNQTIEGIDKRPCIIFMDSLGNSSYKKQLSQPLRDFLEYEWKDKKNSELSFKVKTTAGMRDFSPHVPKQNNSSDCGLFVLEYIEQFLKDPDTLVAKLLINPKNGLLDWFDPKVIKTKRTQIRELILDRIPSEEVKNKIKERIDDSIESDNEETHDITNKSNEDNEDNQDMEENNNREEMVNKVRSDCDDEIGMELDNNSIDDNNSESHVKPRQPLLSQESHEDIEEVH